MSLFDVILLGFALSMDAFAVAVCKGLAMEKATIKSCSIVGAWFGIFQAVMPFIGFLIISILNNFVDAIDHWIGFLLLCLIGINMIKEALSHQENTTGCSLKCKVMFVMSVATSIDALVSGVAFGNMSYINAIISCCIIGITTFILSFLGVKVGSIFGAKYKSKAEFIGGVILILLGLKVLLSGLNII